jgi:hypothetical protein
MPSTRRLPVLAAALLALAGAAGARDNGVGRLPPLGW